MTSGQALQVSYTAATVDMAVNAIIDGKAKRDLLVCRLEGLLGALQNVGGLAPGRLAQVDSPVVRQSVA